MSGKGAIGLVRLGVIAVTFSAMATNAKPTFGAIYYALFTLPLGITYYLGQQRNSSLISWQ